MWLVRPVGRDELGAVYAIELASFDNPYPYWYLEFLHALSGDLFLGAYRDGELAGYIIALPAKGSACHVASLAVSPGYRRRSVGSMLLQSVMEICCSQGRPVLFLEVAVDNHPAQMLYIKSGFKVYKAVKDYYGKGRHALRMVAVDTACVKRGWPGDTE